MKNLQNFRWRTYKISYEEPIKFPTKKWWNFLWRNDGISYEEMMKFPMKKWWNFLWRNDEISYEEMIKFPIKKILNFQSTSMTIPIEKSLLINMFWMMKSDSYDQKNYDFDSKSIIKSTCWWSRKIHQKSILDG